MSIESELLNNWINSHSSEFRTCMCKILGLWAKWLGYCGVGLMSVRANVPLGVCLVGLILVGRLLLYGEITVRSGYCLSYKCPSGYCLSGMCPWGSACRASVRSSYCADTVSLFGKIDSKNQNCLLNLKFEPRLIRKYRTQWWLSCFFLVWKFAFWVNLVQKFEIASSCSVRNLSLILDSPAVSPSLQ